MYVTSNMQSPYHSMQKADNSRLDYSAKELKPDDFYEQSNDGVWKYNFLDMTKSEMQTTLNQLIQSGQMTLDESSVLVGVMSVLPLSKAETPNDEDTTQESFDFIDELKQLISLDKSQKDKDALRDENLALSTLERFQGKTSSINITV